MISQSKLSIIIVNYNAGDLLLKCINSILGSTDKTNYNVIIVDNNSTDNSLNVLPKDERLTIICNDKNNGFGAACNQGVKNTNADYILFLNPDTEVRSNTIASSLKFMTENPFVSVLGCKQVDESGNTLRTCSRFITLSNYINKLTGLSKLSAKIFPDFHMTDWEHNISMIVDHVMGSYYLITREKFLALGLFDEDYFVYLEDLDFSYRVKKSCGNVFYNTDIEIYHETGGTSKNVKAQRLFYSLDSLLIYSKKYFSKASYFILFFLVFLIEPLIRILFNLIGLNFKGMIETLVGYKMLYTKYLFTS